MLSGSEYNILVDAAGNLGALGFIFWLVWHTTNHTLPKITKSFEESVERGRQDHLSALQKQRDDFRDMLGEQRDFFEDRVDAEKRQADKLIDAFKILKVKGG
jgi:hypothetical protein